MATETVIAELLIDIGVDIEGANEAAKKISKVTDEAQKAEKKGGSGLKNLAKDAGKAMAAIGVAAAAASVAIFKLVDGFTTAADQTAKAARTAGLGAEEYQRLAFAAERSGASTEDVSKAARNLTRFLSEAKDKGATPFSEALNKVGLSMKSLEGLSFEDRLAVISDGLLDVEDSSERAYLAQKLLGEEAGPRLASLLESGSRGIRELGQEAENLGVVLSEDALGASEEFQDQMTNLKATITGVVAEVAVELLPVVRETIIEFQKWIGKNKDLIRVNVKKFIKDIIPFLKDLVSGVVSLAEGFGKFVELAGGFEGALVSITAAAVGMKLAFAGALGPVGLIATAFATLLPLAINLGNKMGDVVFEMTQMAQQARIIEGLSGGRAKQRGGQKFLAFANEEDKQRRKELLDERARIAKRLEEQPNLPALQKAAESRLNAINAELRAIQGRGEAVQQQNQRQQEIQDEAKRRSATAGRTFAERQAAGARVREQLGNRKGSDEIVQRVILGEITEEQALQQAKRKRRGPGRAPKPALPEKPAETAIKPVTSLQEFLELTGKQQSRIAEGLIPRKEVEMPVKPEAVINITNNNFTIDMDIQGNGDPAQIGKMVLEVFQQEYRSKMSRAAQMTQTNIAR